MSQTRFEGADAKVNITILFSFVLSTIASALPPGSTCESVLVPPAARQALARAMDTLPRFDRAHVGNLVPGWRGPNGSQEWGIYDNHNRQKVFASRYAYVHPLKTGDHLLVFDENWALKASGQLAFNPRLFQHRDGTMGFASHSITPSYQNDAATRDDALAQDWAAGLNAIALVNMNPEELARWQTELPDFERWRTYRTNPNRITGQDFAYTLAHFETAFEGPFSSRTIPSGIELSIVANGHSVPRARGDWLLPFDEQDRLIVSHKDLEWPRPLTLLGEAAEPAQLREVLVRTKRLVIVKGHFFLNRRL